MIQNVYKNELPAKRATANICDIKAQTNSVRSSHKHEFTLYRSVVARYLKVTLGRRLRAVKMPPGQQRARPV